MICESCHAVIPNWRTSCAECKKYCDQPAPNATPGKILDVDTLTDMIESEG